jgi:hypothetical protein|tara:strand:+ start:826 stop:1587 length:762 start_codon:yes stop_codon:yes gene_type:complete
MQKLTFSIANAKIRQLSKVPGLKRFLGNERKIYSLDLLSGWTCPAAKDCKARVVVAADGKRRIEDSKESIYRCFSASQEGVYGNTYNSRKRNFDALRGLNTSDMVDAIGQDLPVRAGIIRLHVAGDFFNAAYFRAWCNVARLHPDKLFYAYTKSLNFWVQGATPPENLVLTASYGGTHDALIRKHRLRFARVIMSKAQAGKLEIDHDDSHAADPARRRRSFALLLHGVQPKGSEAAVALKALNGAGSYTRDNY